MDLTSTSAALEFCVSLAKVHARLARRFDGRLGSWHGISFADFVVLLHLSRAPGARLRRVDLAAELGLTGSAVTRALIPLEKIGLVRREPDPHDARVGYAVLSKSGHRVVREALESAELISQEAVPIESARQFAVLNRVVRRLAAD
ncbi:MAG TPA: MarR family transcriptional regulator [Vicinamibacterales bacterium]|nr:MarR family transcriptional regulator [Vicinamibacterales bacterium]